MHGPGSMNAGTAENLSWQTRLALRHGGSPHWRRWTFLDTGSSVSLHKQAYFRVLSDPLGRLRTTRPGLHITEDGLNRFEIDGLY